MRVKNSEDEGYAYAYEVEEMELGDTDTCGEDYKTEIEMRKET